MDDTEYFYRRAEAELEMAQKTEVPQAVQAHYTLASAYLDRVYGEGENGGEDKPALPLPPEPEDGPPA